MTRDQIVREQVFDSPEAQDSSRSNYNLNVSGVMSNKVSVVDDRNDEEEEKRNEFELSSRATEDFGDEDPNLDDTFEI